MEGESEMMPMEGSPGSGDYGMEDMDGDNHQYMEGDMNDMEMDDYDGELQSGQDDSDDESMNFEQDPQFAGLPPLDRMRKVRREVLRTINETRERFGNPGIYSDTFTNQAANKYAEFLLTEEENPQALKEICEMHGIIGDQRACVGVAYLEDDHESGDKTKTEEFMDAHGLLLELQEELTLLVDPKLTHVGVGFAHNKQMVKIVELLSVKPLMINTVTGSEDGGCEVRGVMLSKDVGLYAARIYAPSNVKKDLALVGPPNIQFNKNTNEFMISVPGNLEDVFNSEDPKVLEIYIRMSNPDRIKYGVASTERLSVKALVCCIRLPMEFLPDPRTVIEDAQDREKFERDAEERQKRAEEDRLIKQARDLARKEEKAKKREALMAAKQAREADGGMSEDDDDDGSLSEGSRFKARDGNSDGMSGRDPSKKTYSRSKKGSEQEEGSKAGRSVTGSESRGDDDDFDDDDAEDDEEEYDGGVGDLPNHPEMKRELIQAIEDERREYETLKKQNEDCQRKILLSDSSNRDYERQTDQLLNEHKYLNTLANVHQVRFNLKETQDRYNRMASELQAKLNEKQAKCQEIEHQFKELKRSVAQNAVYSRTGKKLPAKMIKEWEETDAAKDQEVHQYRLQNIALRNRLANQEKVLKKKEQLADGLHLIDFEQLKIENQTLNEKIEERHEELNKMRTKIQTTVIILSHWREKYQYILKQNETKRQELQILTAQLDEAKVELGKLKIRREKLQKESLKLKQATGIVTSVSLFYDHELRKEEIKKMKAKLELLKNKLGELQSIVEEARVVEQQQLLMQ